MEVFVCGYSEYVKAEKNIYCNSLTEKQKGCSLLKRLTSKKVFRYCHCKHRMDTWQTMFPVILMVNTASTVTVLFICTWIWQQHVRAEQNAWLPLFTSSNGFSSVHFTGFYLQMTDDCLKANARQIWCRCVMFPDFAIWQGPLKCTIKHRTDP